jgi:AcrR family transcriptional regulator
MRARTDGSTGRTFTEQGRRAQIVQATIEVIAELGYAKTTFARIAERAGLSSTGLISYHFANKSALIEAVLAEIGMGAHGRIAPRVEAEATVLGKLRVRVEAVLAWVSEYPAHVRALAEISTNARGDDGAPVHETLTLETNLRELVPLLRAGQERGELRSFDPLLMALVMKASVDMAVGRMSIEPTLTAQQCADEITELFARAIRREDGDR